MKQRVPYNQRTSRVTEMGDRKRPLACIVWNATGEVLETCAPRPPPKLVTSGLGGNNKEAGAREGTGGRGGKTWEVSSWLPGGWKLFYSEIQ